MSLSLQFRAVFHLFNLSVSTGVQTTVDSLLVRHCVNIILGLSAGIIGTYPVSSAALRFACARTPAPQPSFWICVTSWFSAAFEGINCCIVSLASCLKAGPGNSVELSARELPIDQSMTFVMFSDWEPCWLAPHYHEASIVSLHSSMRLSLFSFARKGYGFIRATICSWHHVLQEDVGHFFEMGRCGFGVL
jgi:hypothetical protein